MSWSHSSSEKRGMGTSKRLGPHFSSAATSLPSLPYPLLARYAANVSCADAVRWGGTGGARQRRQHPPSIAALPLPDAKAQHHHTPCILHPAPHIQRSALGIQLHPAATLRERSTHMYGILQLPEGGVPGVENEVELAEVKADQGARLLQRLRI